ncbi:MAG: bifunctional adenosylcobinamide kinase/adenosylcobinamide-phosphate guanylyltransferase [Bacteroidales bacterium]|nr:bifunctional adenosylcobinamide kinase/adenosylcobinamide-phosphate guanylyltransferase [Bacteroidales bacterium]
MAYIHFITGGQRSGKSSYAQKMTLEIATNKPIYLATSRYWDEDHTQRIKRHQNDRKELFITIEENRKIGSLALSGKTVLLDCITLWLANVFFDLDSNIEVSLEEAKKELDNLFALECKLFIISNEIGMGGHGSTEIQRKFTDLQGWINQYIASLANEVTLMVSGLPLKVK